MSASDAIDLLKSAGPVISVVGISEAPEHFDEVSLNFESGAFTVGCNPDTDELILNWQSAPIQDRSLGTAIRALDFVIGMAPLLVWRMFNSLGYEDALQIRFFSAEDMVDIQFECAASSVAVRSLDDRISDFG